MRNLRRNSRACDAASGSTHAGPGMQILDPSALFRAARKTSGDSSSPSPARCAALRIRNCRVHWSSARALWFLKLTNAGDTLAYNAVTIATVRGLVPLPGRALKTWIRVDF